MARSGWGIGQRMMGVGELARHTKVVHLVENNSFFRSYLSIHSSYCVLPPD
jgi:hypothetical protein